MANQAFSRSDDLMVGAGVLYFKRNDDTNGWHHLGNAEEFTINNNIETVEKNSSMNKKRELMASVVTSIQPEGSITLDEYNPYNLALGLYGTEGVYHQSSVTLTGEPFTIVDVPHVITLADANGNRYMDVQNIVVRPASATPAATTYTGAVGTHSGTASGTTFTDSAGGTIVVSPGGMTSTSATDIYIAIVQKPTAAGDLDGLEVDIQVGAFGTPTRYTVTSSALTATFPASVTAGLPNVTFTVTASDDFTAASSTPITMLTDSIVARYTPGTSAYTPGVDYVVDAQTSRAGIISIKSGGAIKPGDTVLVDASVPDRDFITVSGADAGDIEGELLFVGDPNIGGMYNIEGWKVKITPDGDFTGLISDDFGTFTLTVRFVTDYENHPDYPYYKATLIGRASGTNAKNGQYDPEY